MQNSRFEGLPTIGGGEGGGTTEPASYMRPLSTNLNLNTDESDLEDGTVQTGQGHNVVGMLDVPWASDPVLHLGLSLPVTVAAANIKRRRIRASWATERLQKTWQRTSRCCLGGPTSPRST